MNKTEENVLHLAVDFFHKQRDVQHLFFTLIIAQLCSLVVRNSLIAILNTVWETPGDTTAKIAIKEAVT